MTGPVFLVAVAIFSATVLMIVKTIASVYTGRRASTSELAELQEQCDHYGVMLHETQATLSTQSAQIAELQERLDFAERLLTQARDRRALSAGEQEG